MRLGQHQPNGLIWRVTETGAGLGCGLGHTANFSRVGAYCAPLRCLTVLKILMPETEVCWCKWF